MQVRIGSADLDPDLRPIVVAAAPSIADDQPLETAIKQAIGQGADLVEVPVARLDTSGAAGRRASSPAMCVSCARLDEVDRALDAGAIAVRWVGESYQTDDVRDRLGAVPLVVSGNAAVHGATLRSGDWWVVAWEHRHRLEGRGAGVLGLVDLGACTERAEVAAAVTVAMEGRIDGFVTVAPTAARRAAHVIRAVERTR